MIGLSATPYRTDDSQKLFGLFFEPRALIFKPLLKPHTVYKVETGLKIKLTQQKKTGRIDWGAVLQAQTESPERNALIVNIVKERPNAHFLILSKRVEHIKAISNFLFEAGIPNECLYGSKKPNKNNLRILVGSFQKLGKGFDRADFNALILSADVEQYFVQSLGRVFRDPSVEPVIFDLVDDNFILEKHFKARAQVYRDAGGTVQVMKRSLRPN